MSYRFAFQASQRLLVVLFEGNVSPDEERAALLEVATHPDFDPDAPVLVDRRRSRMEVQPSDVPRQIELAREHYQPSDRPRMALVVGNDYDFGMARMLELTGSDDVPHELHVFRSIEEACDWLGVELTAIVWP